MPRTVKLTKCSVFVLIERDYFPRERTIRASETSFEKKIDSLLIYWHLLERNIIDVNLQLRFIDMNKKILVFLGDSYQQCMVKEIFLA